MRVSHRLPSPLMALALSAPLFSCGDDGASGTDRAAVITQYVKLVRANYDDSIEAAKVLQAAVDELVDSPSRAHLDAARKAWIDARVPYLQTEAFRFYDGPIDLPTDVPREGQINAWPLDERAIDYVLDSDGETVLADGIINDRDAYPEITAAILIDENAAASETEVLLGYHAIEFLLWGQDFNDDGPGDRPYTDYVPSDEGAGVDAERRAQYLTVVTDQLVADLEAVRADWDDGADYHDAFVGDTDRALLDIQVGIFSLMDVELAGERITAPYGSGDQEDEHSCFSDNTHADFEYDLVGLENVYYGKYGELTGPGLYDVLLDVDADLAKTIAEQIDAAKAATDAIPDPFDQAIQDDAGLKKIKTTIDRYTELRDSLSLVEAALK